MKTVLRSVLPILIFICFLTTKRSDAQNFDLVKSYVVIGAFEIESNADKYVKWAQTNNLEAQHRLNTHRKLYYVYVFESKNREEAVEKLGEVRIQKPNLKDAWLYSGDFKGPHISSDQFASLNRAVAKVETESSSLDNTENVTEKEPVIMEPEKVEVEPELEPEPEPEPEPEGVKFYFGAFNQKTEKPVGGKINIIDPERARLLDELDVNGLVYVKDPKNGTNRIKLSTNIFGFRERQYTIDLDNPVNDTTRNFLKKKGDTLMVEFPLERFKKGDVLTMYNVYFFKDAAIMQTESLFELKSLLDMLKENEKLEIRIIGHTNGKAAGPIKSLDHKGDRNFFNIKSEHKEGFGSAKKLSEERAYTIQQWLVDQGISEDRMSIKGMGGKQMIYDQHSTQAYKNVRVEIEILKE